MSSDSSDKVDSSTKSSYARAEVKEATLAEGNPIDVRHGAGLGGHLKRNISVLGIIGLGLSICNGWAAMSSTIVIGLSQGGTVVVLYGLIFTSLLNVFIALTLGELSAAYPSAGGQYVWSSILASGTKWKRGISFAVGWITIFEWLTITASVVIIAAEVVFAIVQVYHPTFTIARWMIFCIFMAVNVISLAFNLFGLQRMPWMGQLFLYFSSATFLVILITCVAKAPSYQSNEFVWATYTNEIGWTSGFVVVATGLVNPAYVYAGIDGAVHIAADCLDPARAVPMALLATVGMALFTGLTMSIGLLYSMQDLDTALASELPFLEIIVQATGSDAAGVVFMVAYIMCLIVSSNSVHQATSRLIWSFAQDRGLPFSDRLSKIHPTLQVPVIPVLLSFLGVSILGALYVATTTVYSAIISCCIILGNISYAIPAVQLMARGRRMNPNRWLKLGWLGWLSNIVTVVWCAFSSVIWLFPLESHPTAATMNYSVAVLGVMAILAVLDWIFVGRHHFKGPEIDDLLLLDQTEDVAEGTDEKL